MKNKPILIALMVFLISGKKALAQDAVFTQWENMPLYINPALTGNFDGLLRISAVYRNQWESLLKDNSYKTSAVSADYKFSSGSVRKISVGVFGIHDKAGGLDFTNQAINIATSITQHLGNPEHKHHSIAFGLNVGLANSKLDLENANWPGGPPPDLNEKINFADVSAGLLWQFRSNTHFTFQMGGALHHLNRPNVSFFETGVSRLDHRFNLHGHVEIPLVHSFSIVPSFLFSDQGPSEQLLFGFNNKWYPKPQYSNYIQLGIFAKTSKNYSGTTAVNIYVLSATLHINSFLVGFSFDRFQNVKSNAYEFSVGYTFGMHGSKGSAGNKGHLPPGLTGRT